MKRPSVAELLKRIEALEAQNEALRARVEQLEWRALMMPVSPAPSPICPQPCVPPPPYVPIWVGPNTTTTGPAL